MTEHTQLSFATRWRQLAVLGISLVGAGAVAVIHAPPATSEDALGALLLGLVCWPISFAKVLATSKVVAMVLLAGYWPAVGFCCYWFLVRGKWAYALPIVLLMVVPALEAAEVFESFMGV